MANTTYVALETKTLGSAVSSVTFDVSSYTDYDDLQIVFSGGISVASANSFMRFNGDTGSNYSRQYYEGRQGGAAATGRSVSTVALQIDNYGAPSTTKSMFTVDIFSFRKTGYFRPVLTRYGDTTNSTYSGVGYCGGLWMNTANAITSIQIYPGSGNWNAGSTFTLYGFAKSNAGAKATGGVVYSDVDYFYHVFGVSGTFTPTQSISADILVIAGGGGGGYDNGGGGGAGGVALYSNQSLTTTGYTCTVGAGGSGSSSSTVKGATGGTSQFAALTSKVGGGGGGSNSSRPGASGASGGGGSGEAADGTGGSPTDGFAGASSNGGFATNLAYNSGGGGGSAAAAIQPASSPAVGGNGGLGVSTYSTWLSATGLGKNGLIAGGGGGATLQNSSTGAATGGIGSGGGGNGGGANTSTVFTNATNALAGSGSGGGGGNRNVAGTFSSGNGGSGIVIVRYAKV